MDPQEVRKLPQEESENPYGREGGEAAEALDRLVWKVRRGEDLTEGEQRWLIAEVERLRAEREKLRSTDFTARVICQTQKEENARLREALGEYANEDHWARGVTDAMNVWVGPTPHGAELAEEALRAHDSKE